MKRKSFISLLIIAGIITVLLTNCVKKQDPATTELSVEQMKIFRALKNILVIETRQYYGGDIILPYQEFLKKLLKNSGITTVDEDGREYDAELIGGDEMSDIALLKLSKKVSNLTQIKLADSPESSNGVKSAKGLALRFRFA